MNRKAELKAAYKQNAHRLRRMGVYAIRNQLNGKVYLDATTNLDGAIERDRLWLSKGGHLNVSLQHDWNSYGSEAFRFEILEMLKPTDDPRDYPAEIALLLEIWKEELAPYGDKGYLPAPRAARAAHERGPFP